MDTENIIKSELLKLFNEGKSETEAYKEISKSHSSNDVSEKTVGMWFEEFKSGDSSLNDKVASGPKEKLTDEQVIDLINKNPGLSVEKIARLANCSGTAIRYRIKKINNSEKSVNYSKKDCNILTDEYLINLINENPDFSIQKISKLAKCSERAIRRRIEKINNSGESVNYQKKDNFKFTDEYLIDLVDKNPDLNMGELAKLAGASKSAISTRIRKIKSAGKSIRYISKNDPSRRSESSVASNPKLTNEYLINLINENPDLTIEKLSVLADTSYATMQRRIKQINKYSEKVVYHKKDNKKFTDKYLINLVESNPELSMEKLAILTGTSYSTIVNRINQINDDGKEANYHKKDNKKFTDEYLINLVESNPELSMEKLATVLNTSTAAICSRFNVNINCERVNYVNKGSGSKFKSKLTDEYLINLINENPELNMKELAKLAGTNRETISRRIRQINKDGERVKYVNKNRSKV